MASRRRASWALGRPRLLQLLLLTTASPAGLALPPSIDPASVPTLALPGGGSMPMSGLGLCCRPTSTGDAVRQSVLDYLLLGGRHLDDAQLYNNHKEVGEGIQQAMAQGVPREEIFLTSKIWPDTYGFLETTEWVESMLRELNLDYVDLVLLHKPGRGGGACGEPKQCRQETWLALCRARDRGLIRHLGVSNFGPRQMGELMSLGSAPLAVNQLEFHPWVPKIHRASVAFCHEHGIAVTAYGSMGGSAHASQFTTLDPLKQVGGLHGKTPGQILLRWAIEKNVSVIPGTANPAHMIDNLKIFDFKLADYELTALDSVPEKEYMLHFGHTPDGQL